MMWLLVVYVLSGAFVGWRWHGRFFNRGWFDNALVFLFWVATGTFGLFGWSIVTFGPWSEG